MSLYGSKYFLIICIYSCKKFKFAIELYLYIKSFGGEMEDNFNIHLGKKLRMRRLSLGLTQTKVAEAINVTFQQIQKYEKGTNGVSSARLMQISHFLKVPITYFYEEYKDYKAFGTEESVSGDLNYSFLLKTFNNLSKLEREKILQVLKNAETLDKTG